MPNITKSYKIYCNCKDEHKGQTSILLKKKMRIKLTIHFHSGEHQPIPNFGSKPSLWVHVRTHNLCFELIIRK